MTSRRLSPSLKVRVNGLPSIACPSFVMLRVTLVVWAAVVVSTLVVVEFVFAGACPHAVNNKVAVKIPIIFFIRISFILF